MGSIPTQWTPDSSVKTKWSPDSVNSTKWSQENLQPAGGFLLLQTGANLLLEDALSFLQLQ